MTRTIHIFSDASFDKASQLAVAGYLLLDNSTLSNSQETEVVLWPFAEKNNIRAELRGAIGALNVVIKKRREGLVDGLEWLNDNTESDFGVTLYTDCESIARLPERQHRLEANHFLSKKTGKLLNNADLYQEFFTAYQAVQPTLEWVKGHTAKSIRSPLQSHFSRVDTAVRKKLRSLVALLP